MDTLAKLVADFLEQGGCRSRGECCPDGEIKAFSKLNIKDAIIKATQARLGKGVRPDGTRKLHPHQRYLPQKTADNAQIILLKCTTEIIKNRKKFDALHELVKSELQIYRAGEMYWYDTAFRIGISMGTYDKTLYIRYSRLPSYLLGTVFKRNIL